MGLLLPAAPKQSGWFAACLGEGDVDEKRKNFKKNL